MEGLDYLTEFFCYTLSHPENIRVYAPPKLEISRNPRAHAVQFGKNEADHGLQPLVSLREGDEIASFNSVLQRKLARTLFSPFFVRGAPGTPLPQMLDVSLPAFV
jgi:hypothetical protein